MSKGRNLTKRKWKDFRKSNSPKGKIKYKPKFPRSSKFISRYDGNHLSMGSIKSLGEVFI